jgi:hypothetical protein
MSNRRKLRPRPHPRWKSADHEPTVWLRGRLGELLAAHDAGQVELCDHLAAGSREFGVTALWRPDLTVCHRLECGSRLLLTGDADRTCDRCGTVADVIHSNHVSPLHARPDLIVHYGLCCRCQRLEVAGPCGDELVEIVR